MKENRQKTQKNSLEDYTPEEIDNMSFRDGLLLEGATEEDIGTIAENLSEIAGLTMKAADIIKENPKFSALTKARPSEINENPELKKLFAEALVEASKRDQRHRQINLPKTDQQTSNEDIAKTMSFIGSRLASISNPRYRHAFDTKPNQYAYVSKVGEDFFKNFAFDKYGNAGPIEDTNKQEKLNDIIKNGSGENDDGPDKALMMAFFTSLLNKNNWSDSYGGTITVNIPNFCKDLRIRANQFGVKNSNNRRDLFEDVNTIREYVGILNQNRYIKVLEIIEFNEEKQTLTFVAPYLAQVLQELEIDPKRNVYTRDKKTIKYKKGALDLLWHSDIANEKNKAAIEVAEVILYRLLKRGGRPDSTYPRNKYKRNYEKAVTITTSVGELLQDCPVLFRRINATNGVNENAIATSKNEKLKKAFNGALKLLHTKTDAYTENGKDGYWIDLEIKTGKISMKKLDEEIVISHNGVNGKYKIPPK